MKTLKVFPHGRLYALWTKEKGILGFTPEFLFEKKGRSLKTHALAGTRKKGEESLLKNKKELKEHEIVVKGLRESLKDLGGLKKRKTGGDFISSFKTSANKAFFKFKKRAFFPRDCKKTSPFSGSVWLS